MKNVPSKPGPEIRPRCCPCGEAHASPGPGVTRRTFLKGMGATALGSVAAGGLAWPLFAGGEFDAAPAIARLPLKVMPILVYDTPQRRPQTSWRAWGGIQTQRDADEEAARIKGELDALSREADFPVEFLPLIRVRGAADVPPASGLASAHVLLVYAAGGWMDTFDALAKAGRDMIFFCRHKSGPVYLWYEIISPRYLRQHTDSLAVKIADEGDVVIDSQPEILWRLRALAGLRNTLGTRILAVGGPDGWSQPRGVVPKLVEDIWKFEILTVSYDELGGLIGQARADTAAVRRSRARADEYLRQPGTSLETERAA